MPTTTNFGWTTPADTDYVKDGALAIRTLGNGIDTSLVDLKGGTTGQILSKASNTDLDYTWINNDQGDITAVNAGTGISVSGGTGPTPTVSIDSTVATLTGTQTLTNKTIDGSSNTISNISLTTGVTGTLPIANGGTNLTTYTTGDLPYASATNTLAKLGIGSTGQVLKVSGGVPAWAAESTGKVLQIQVGTLTTTATTTSTSFVDTGLTVSITPSSVSNEILIFASVPFSVSGSGDGGFLTLADGSNNNLINASSPGNRKPSFARFEPDTVNQFFMLGTSLVFKHSPASTSSQTYKVRYSTSNSTVTALINRVATDSDSAAFSRGVATIIAMEVQP